MKKILLITILFLGIVVTTPSAFASDSNYSFEKMNKKDKEEIKQNEEDILSFINMVFESEYPEMKRKKELIISKAVKIYTDTDIFKLKSSSKNTIMKAFEGGKYVYDVLVKNEDKTVRAILVKAEKLNESDKKILTEEEYKDLKKEEGKWVVSSAGVVKEKNYINSAYNIPSFYEDVVLARSLPGLQYPVAIAFENGKASKIISLYNNPETVYSLFSSSRKEEQLLKDNIYYLNYDKVSSLAEKEFTPASNRRSTTSTGISVSEPEENKRNYIWGILMIALVGGTVIIFLIKSLDSKRNTQE